MIIAAIGFLFSGLLIFFISLPLACRKVPMNPLYGIKFAAAYESEQRWYDINSYGGRRLAAWSWLIVTAGLIGFFLPNGAVSIYVPVSTVVVLLALLIPLVQIIRHLPPQAGVTQKSSMASPASAAPIVTHRTIVPALVLALLCIGYLIFVIESAQWLPPRVATHFTASGQPNGWMHRESYLLFVAILGLAIAGVIASLGVAMSILYARWKSSGRSIFFTSKRNMSYMGGDIIWAACLFLCFIAGTHYSTIAANQNHPAHLAPNALGILITAYVIGNTAWLILFIVHLMKKEPSQ